MTTVLKLGGELLEDSAAMKTMAAAVVRLAALEHVVVVRRAGGASDEGDAVAV